MLSIPEHDLERRQRKQCNPNLRIQESFHGSLFVVALNDVEWRSRRFSELGDLRRSSREIRNPNLRIQESFHGSLFVVALNDVEWRSRRFSELGDLRR